MKKHPKVSIIIPTFNRAHLLPRTITSVLSQTFKDFELIIVDDGSTDNTREIVKEFQKEDSRIKYIWQKNSGGPASPRNTGIKNSLGEYIAFLDSDDEWLPEKLEKQIGLSLSQKELKIIGCNCWKIKNAQKKKHKIQENILKKDPFSKMLEGCCFITSPSSVIVPAKIFSKVGLFDEKIKVSDDWDMWIRILKNYTFDFVRDPLFNYHIHGENISGETNKEKQIKDCSIILKKNKECYEKNLLAKSKILSYVGSYHIANGRKKLGKKYFLKSLKYSPLYYKNYINLLISLFGVKVYAVARNIKIKTF